MSILSTHLLHFSANLLKYFLFLDSLQCQFHGAFSPEMDVNAGL